MGELSRPQAPCFEQLEPRVLLSADAFMPIGSPLYETPFEAAIVVDLETDQAVSCQPSAISQVEEPNRALSFQLSALSESAESGTDSGIGDTVVGSQLPEVSEEASETESVACEDRSGCETVTLSNTMSLPQLAIAAELTLVQQNETQFSIVDASEDLAFHTSHLTPHTSILGIAQNRGPPAGAQENSTVLNEVAYTPSDEITDSPAIEGPSIHPRPVQASFIGQQPTVPELPGLTIVDPDISSWQGQIIYLDFDGAEDVVYNGPVTVGPFDVPAFAAPGDLAGQEDAIISEVLFQLEQTFPGTGIIFTTEQPSARASLFQRATTLGPCKHISQGSQPFSTIYIGGDDSAFAEYGSFLGLAEQVDAKNTNPSDNGFVFASGLARGNRDSCDDGSVFSEQAVGGLAEGYAASLAELVAHEVGHLLGFSHGGDVDHGKSLMQVAAEPNDDPAGATQLTNNQEFTSQVTESDSDWYRIDVTGPGGLDWEVYSYGGGPYVSLIAYEDGGSTSPPFRSVLVAPTDSEDIYDIPVSGGSWTYYAVVSESTSQAMGNGYYRIKAQFTYTPPPDTSPPSPNPSQWLQEPFATSDTEIQMSAQVTSDPQGSDPCQYYFDFVEGSGGHDSGWISENAYVDDGLTPNSSYGYKVYARDSKGNETSPANKRSAYTLAALPAAPTVSNPTASSLDITPLKGSNPFETELAVYNVTLDQYLAADGSSNGSTAYWQREYDWGTVTNSGLSLGSTYEYQVKAQNHDGTETVFGDSAQGTTLSPADFDIVAFNIDNPSVEWGGDLQYDVDIVNSGGSEGTAWVKLIASNNETLWDGDDQLIFNEEVTLSPNGHWTLTDDTYDLPSLPWNEYTDNDTIYFYLQIGAPYNDQTGPLSRNVSLPPVLEVPYYSQNDHNWCWAAATSMIIAYYGYERNPWEVAADFNAGPDEGKESPEIESYLEDQYDAGQEDAWGIETVSDSESLVVRIRELLSAGKPVLCGRLGAELVPTLPFSEGSAHAVVITGYNSTGFTVHDPSGAMFLGDDFDLTHVHVNYEDFKDKIEDPQVQPFGLAKIIYAKSSDLQENAGGITHGLATIQLLPEDWIRSPYAGVIFENAYGLEEGSRKLSLEWDGSDPMPGYKLTAEDLGWHVDGHATLADVLSLMPHITNFSPDREQLDLRITAAISRQGGTQVDSWQSEIIQVPEYVYIKKDWESSTEWLADYDKLCELAPDAYSLTLSLDGRTTGSELFELYDEITLLFDLRASPYAAVEASLLSVPDIDVPAGSVAEYTFEVTNRGSMPDVISLLSSAPNAQFVIGGTECSQTQLLDVDETVTIILRTTPPNEVGLRIDPIYTSFKSAQDVSKNSNDIQLALTVVPSNHAPTDIALSQNVIVENEPSGTAVCVISGSDPDAGQSTTLTFSLVSGYGDNSLFTIDGSTSELKTVISFNYEVKSNYDIKIRATDTGTPALTYDEVFTIDVTDVNDAPVAEPFTRDGLEDQNQAVTMPSTDEDGDTLTYIVESGPSHGVLSEGTGASRIFDPDSDWYGTDSFTFRAYDGELYSDQETVTLNLASVNDRPSFTASDPVAVEENTRSQTVVGWATFSPGPANESSQTVLYYTVSNVSNPALFGSEPTVNNSGTLRYTPATDASGISTFQVVVRDDGGTDNAGEDTSDFQTFTISITGDNNLPIDISLSSSSILENQVSGTTVGTLTTSDPDVGDTHTYSLVAGTGSDDNGSFVISGDQLLTDAVFDYETKNSYSIRIKTDDGNSGTYEEVFVIAVTDANDAPVIDAVSNQVGNEGRAVTLNAVFTDEDVSDTHTASINWGDGTSDNIDPATSPMTTSHVYADDGTYTVTVTVTDDEGASVSDTIEVSIGDMAPILTLDPVAAINEDGTATLTGTITDPRTLNTFTLDIDWGDPLSPNNVEQYSFGASDTGSQVFSLTHQYLDDNPGGTSTDTYTITATIAVDDAWQTVLHDDFDDGNIDDWTLGGGLVV